MVHYERGMDLHRAGGLDGAIAEFREAIRLKPDDSGVPMKLGNALADKGDLDGAIAGYRDALRLKPDDTDARAALV